MKQQYIIPNLSKTCELLGYLAGQPDGVSAGDIERSLNIPKTTAFRVLRTLCAGDMAQKRGNLYFAGGRLIRIGLQALNGVKLRELSVPVLRELAGRTQQTSHVAILSGRQSLILEVCDSPGPVRVASRAGTLVDLHCSSTGKVFLATLPAEQFEQWLAGSMARRTERTLTDAAAIRAEIEAVRKQGYACDDEEFHRGVRCLAAPVYDLYGTVIAAIGITGTSGDISKEKISFFAQQVMEAAGELSAALGYKGQPQF